jgi:hypothetical protein
MVKKQRKKEQGPLVPQCLMDVFLKSWIYFDHSHGTPAPKVH